MTTTCCNSNLMKERVPTESSGKSGSSFWRRLKSPGRLFSAGGISGSATRLHRYRHLSVVTVDRVLDELDRKSAK